MISDFPLLTWLIFPVTGFIFGKMLIRVRDKKGFYSLISVPALMIALIYMPIGIYHGWGMFGEGQNYYYHMKIWDVCACICLDIGMLGAWHWMSGLMRKGSVAFLREVSRNITSIYCIHWVFVRTITNVILYIKNGTQILPLWQTLLLSLAILLVTLIIAHYYRIMKKILLTERGENLPETIAS